MVSPASLQSCTHDEVVNDPFTWLSFASSFPNDCRFDVAMTFPNTLVQTSHQRSFGGWQDVYQHHSEVLDCDMNFAVYLPPQAETKSCPVVYWLSGLTCTEQNFITKAGAQQYAAQHGLIVIAPDTSPRGCNLPGEDDSYDFGSGAGFYLNATQAPWAEHYRMYDYVVVELPRAIDSRMGAGCGRSEG